MTKFADSGRRWAIRAGGALACALAILLGADPAMAAEPLSLDQCIDVALKNNPGLAQAGWQLKGSEANRLANMQAFLPTLGIQMARTKNTSAFFQDTIDPNTGQIVKGNQKVTDQYWTDQVSLSQNLVHPPDWYSYAASNADVAASREAFRGSRADLIYLVRQGYFALLGRILLKQNAEEALAVSEEQLKRSQALFDVGSVARSDVLQSRVNRANAVRDEISARNAVEQTRAALAVLLGLNAPDPLEIKQDVEPPIATEVDEAGLIREALDTRPEVRQAGEQLRAAKLRYRSTWWSHFPTLGLTMYYQKSALTLDKTLDTGLIDQDARWGYAFGFRWNVFDGMSTYGAVRRNRADVYSAREKQRQEELNAGLGVREARISINNASEGMTAAEEAVALAEENFKLQQALYQNGAGTILELNNAQVDRTKAKNALVEATISLHLANAQLDRALGR
jgi:outer membrane protein TolC